MALHRDDRLQESQAWVLGCCFEWNKHYGQFTIPSRQFDDFVERTHLTIWRYLQGHIELDGKCSDFECVLGLRAKRLFEPHLVNKED